MQPGFDPTDHSDRVVAGDGILSCIQSPREPVTLYRDAAGLITLQPGAGEVYGQLPSIYPEWLGDATFTRAHGCRFPYVVGEMARGIATPAMVIAGVEAGLAAFYGSAGLRPDTIADGLSEIESGLGGHAPAWGANLIHTPQQTEYEREVVDLFLARGVARVSASAFMKLSAEVVRYAAAGLSRGTDGAITRSTHVFAKVSRAEVARQFMAPAPEKLLRALAAEGRITEEQAELASHVPIACDITAEADSGGHTDNRAASPLFSSISEARRGVAAKHGIDASSIRIGLAGGIATPHGVAAAFEMGAAYVLTGSINQSALTSGLSLAGREALAKAGPADVAMAPAADMFEQGVKVQVLKRGTLFAMRSLKMHEFYRSRSGLDDLSDDDVKWLEDVMGESLETAWTEVVAFMRDTNPAELERAEADPKKKMALVFRRYLFMGSQWARDGADDRRSDFQIWCGPSMGAFNEWVSGSFLEPLDARTIRQIAWNLMEGAACITRAAQLRSFGVAVPGDAFDYRPREFG